MKIKIAILDQDKGYLARMASRFNVKYAQEMELHYFSDLELALADLKKSRIDVFLASELFEISKAQLPRHCVFAYLVSQNGVDTLNGCNAICKFQKSEQIFKQIQSLYAEISGSMALDMSGESAKVIAFVSASGGVGSSTLAAACAMHYAQQQRSVMYLNLETISTTGAFFSGEGQADFRDVITTLKNPTVNLQIKLGSYVRKDASGVDFFAPAGVALDMLELETEDAVKLIRQLQFQGSYDYLILDVDFALTEPVRQLLREAHSIVMVSDGTQISNRKTEQAYMAMTYTEADRDDSLLDRLVLLYNRVSSNHGQSVAAEQLRCVGGAPRYSGAEPREVALQMARMDFFDNL